MASNDVERRGGRHFVPGTAVDRLVGSIPPDDRILAPGRAVVLKFIGGGIPPGIEHLHFVRFALSAADERCLRKIAHSRGIKVYEPSDEVSIESNLRAALGLPAIPLKEASPIHAPAEYFRNDAITANAILGTAIAEIDALKSRLEAEEAAGREVRDRLIDREMRLCVVARRLRRRLFNALIALRFAKAAQSELAEWQGMANALSGMQAENKDLQEANADLDELARSRAATIRNLHDRLAATQERLAVFEVAVGVEAPTAKTLRKKSPGQKSAKKFAKLADLADWLLSEGLLTLGNLKKHAQANNFSYKNGARVIEYAKARAKMNAGEAKKQ